MSKITGKTKVCMIIGDPVEHSLSPQMHNAGYKALGIDDEFVFTAANVKIEEIESVVKAVRIMGIRGLTCTMPHKIEVMKYIDEIDPVAKKIGAVNTVVNDDGVLKGYNTDWLGTVVPLKLALGWVKSPQPPFVKGEFEKEKSLLQGKKVALIGAGGAARAMAFGIVEEGAELKIFNRTIEKADDLANDLNTSRDAIHHVSTDTLNAINKIQNYDIIINSTSLGMGENEDKSPVPKELINEKHICFDAVYSPYETKFLKEAKEKGAKIIHGTEMLLHQGTSQFELYTGHEAPEKVMKKVLSKK